VHWQILQDIEAELVLIAGWRGETGRIRQEEEEEQLVDIKEEYKPDQVQNIHFWYRYSVNDVHVSPVFKLVITYRYQYRIVKPAVLRSLSKEKYFRPNSL
jgi:hypothetical protein